MQTIDPTIFCLISLLVLGVFANMLREVDWTAESRRDQEQRANKSLQATAGKAHRKSRSNTTRRA
jgi:hypothetical protein